MKLWKPTGWKFGRKLPYLFHYLGYLGKQEEMALDTFVSVHFLLFSSRLVYRFAIGLQVGLQTL